MSASAVLGRYPVLALAALLTVAVLGAAPAVGSDGPTGDGVAAAGPNAATNAVDEANETVRHRDPSSYSEAADREGLANALERQLRRQLSEGTIELREGNYELASEYVGESFDVQLAEYARLAGETGRGKTAAELESARAELVALTETRRRYGETYEEYEAAQAADDDERALELARELEALARQINGSSQSLADHYGAIEAETGADLGESTDAAESVGTDIRDRQADVREAVFEVTLLSVDADSGTISYTDPLPATGRLATADGEPIGGETIRLDVGNQSLSVETDIDGSFAFSYRPVSIPVSAESVSVTYVPANESAYLGAETSVPVSIDQADPTVAEPTVVTEPNGSGVAGETVAYGDAVTVSTTVAVEGEPVDALPLAVGLGETTLGVVETDADGTIAESVTIPASVPAGERDVSVAIPFDGRALAGSSASAPVSVRETTPELTLEPPRLADGDVEVNGSLRAAGTAVSNHSVTIAVGGEPRSTMTDAEGRFGTVAALPDSASGDVAVTASLDGRGSNLEPAEASATLAVPAGGSGGVSLRGVPAWILGGLVAVAVASPVGWHLWRRRVAATGSEPAFDRSLETGAAAASAASRPSTAALLSRARDAVRAERSDEAVRAAYSAVRRHLNAGADDAHTPREFSRACDQSAARERSLRALTEDYERATFRPGAVDGSTADRALSLANALCDGSGGGLDAGDAASRADD